MTGSKIGGAAVALWSLALGWPAAQAQIAYIPPGAERPRFGGEIALSQVGPVAGYWPTECRTWRLRTDRHRDGALAAPPLNAAFHRFIGGLIQERPSYDDMTPPMAEAVKRNLSTYWPSLARMGDATVAKRIDTDEAGNDLYVIDQRGGATHWNISVDPQGKIEAAFVCKGEGV